MSHELRTPLNAIIGYSELVLEETELSNPKSVDDLKNVLGAANHLLSLINNVLDLAKIDAGKMDLILECFDIRDVVREAAQTVQPMMTKNNNRLQVSCPESIGTMTSDRIKVYQCVLNILSNAAKYTDSGQVECRVTRVTEDQNNWTVIIIEDTGIGIPENKMKNLFEEFSQMDSSIRHQTGTGLGLALTRQMCQLLGGNVVAHSQTGLGSTFILRFPECMIENVNNTEKSEHMPIHA
jgi:signal transduction histidine kinase